MVGILVLSHGGLARELLASARVISGELADCEALTLDWHDTVEEATQKVAAVLPRLDRGDGVLILTDMFGSTPSNVAMGFRQEGRVEVISGVNLPMIVRLGCLTSKNIPLTEMTIWIRDKGRSSICGGFDMKRPPSSKPGCEE